MTGPTHPTEKGPVEASVIVVSHDSEPWIARCLEHLRRQTFSSYEVIVVDAGSQDRTREILRGFPEVSVIESVNRGFGAGNNQGAAAARGRVLAFVNPDTAAEPEWLSKLIEPLAQPGTITTSQLLLMHDRERINTLGLDVHFTGFGLVRGLGKPVIGGSPGPVPAVSGAAFAILKEDFLKLGGFDERIFLYGEDVDLSCRARARGYRLLAVPSSRVAHRYDGGLTPFKLGQVERWRALYSRDYLTGRERLAYSPSVLLARVLVDLAARRMGTEAQSRIRAVRQEVASLPRKAVEISVSRYARRTIPRANAASLSSAHAPFLLLVNVFFLLNTAWWIRRRRRWLNA